MNATEIDPQTAADDQVYHELLNEVDYHCSLCEGVHQSMGVLNSKMELLYKWVTNKTKADRSLPGTLKNWMAAYYVASEIRQAVCFKK